MPYRFRFRSNDGGTEFTCPLQCERCRAQTARGTRCSRNSCIGAGYCWSHLLSIKHLRIKTSGNAAHGKGLWAVDKQAADDAIIFQRGDEIIAYEGELIDDDELDERYGQFTGPYALKQHRDRIYDSACERGVGSLANHRSQAGGANAEYRVRHGALSLVASRPIRNGQEIFVSYGRAYRFDEPTTHSTRYVRN